MFYASLSPRSRFFSAKMSTFVDPNKEALRSGQLCFGSFPRLLHRPSVDTPQNKCKHFADKVQALCRRSIGTLQTKCGHFADEVQTPDEIDIDKWRSNA